MNLIPESPMWLIAILFAALIAAAVEDFIRLRISNVTVLIVVVTALAAMALSGFSTDLWQNLAVFAVLFGAGYLLFAAKKMGGGDVKLLAALGLWVNITDGIWLLWTSLLAGGVLALIYILVRRSRISRGEKHQSKGIPYGIAIAAGASLVFVGQMGLIKSEPPRADPFAVRPLP